MPIRALIMAGGRGERLLPYTALLPKPLMPVGDRSILELVIEQLVRHGITDLVLALNHLAPLIQAYLGDGSHFGTTIRYVHEDEPLGTAGPIAMLDDIDDTLLVSNGDILADINFSKMLAQHREAGAAVTVATKYVPYTLRSAVLDTDDEGFVQDYREKPTVHHRVAIGAYLLEPTVCREVASGQRLDMPDLIRSMMAQGRRVLAYDHPGIWIDIGNPDDFARAQQAAESLLVSGELELVGT